MMYAVFYAQDNDGLWKEVRLASGQLSDYAIADDGQVLYKDKHLLTLLEESCEKKVVNTENLWDVVIILSVGTQGK